MVDLCERKNCCGCAACVEICPRQAIVLKKNDMGFQYPEINEDLCIECKRCEKVCTILKSSENFLNSSRKYFAYQGSKKACLKSSSGGFAHELARKCISKNFAVCGAVFCDNFSAVKFDITENVIELEPFRGSKYIAVNMGEIYETVYKFLDSGKNVLFFGLPCHIAGLKTYINQKKKTNGELYTVDLLCHGVGSPYVWNLALDDFCESKAACRDEIEEINFRSKPETEGKKLLIKIKNTPYYMKPKNFPYYYGFENRLIMRDSCYSCKYRSSNRTGDITIGDMIPIDSNGWGRSVVLINSEKGENIIQDIPGLFTSLKDEEIQKLIKRICSTHLNVVPKFKTKIAPKNLKDYKKLSKTYLNPNYKPLKYKIIGIIKKIIK